ncbi:hypothetical protein M2454_002510 [Aequitasia blattaphilus]|uniref:Transglutaminase-like domain-containing protein n=1 Tax=Aequitasia blattaphilus TaxID=2949332 RepID=A0ABT1EC62_9FIRM|nr:transglutaminase domain-containing protein [Aequitasia blattaphilus]MCP1103398.1 hypothetical protein [Aequitasia blattaphilus]MCR8616038.1 hypothetical protein [Aequitasia blattaphilus]
MKKVIGVLLLTIILLLCGGAYFFFTKLPQVFKEQQEKIVEEEIEQIPYKEVQIGEDGLSSKLYYNTYSDEEKLAYREILQGVLDHDETITIHTTSHEKAFDIFEDVIKDHGEIFWCDGEVETVTYEEPETYIEMEISYNFSKEERVEKQGIIDNEIDNIILQIDPYWSEYEKVLFVYRYLVLNTDYDMSAPDNQNIYSVFGNKVSVCAGYAKAFQVLMERLGIPASYVIGIAREENHAWNIVTCEGQNYFVDVTWGDPIFTGESPAIPNQESYVIYDYMCTSYEQMSKTHTFEEVERLPACESMACNYYVRNGLYHDAYDPGYAMEVLNQSINNRMNEYVFKYSNEAAYQGAQPDLINNVIPTVASNLAAQLGYSQVEYYYMDDTELNKVTIFWQY